MRKEFNLFWIFLFLIGASVPLYHTNTSGITKQENRILAKFPEVKKKGKINSDYGKEFELWLGDRFWGRDKLIATRFQVLYKINGRIENEKAFIGDEGWMFEKSKTINIPSIEKQRENIEEDAEILKKFADKFKDKNIPIYLVIVPMREVLYQKYWDRYYRPISQLDYDEELIKLLADQSNIKIISVKKKLEELSKNELVFYKDDEHLADLPRQLIIKEVFKRLKLDGIIDKKEELIEKYEKKEGNHVANISAILGMEGNVRHYLPTLSLSSKGLKSTILEGKKFEVLSNGGWKGSILIPYIKSENKGVKTARTGIFFGPCYTEDAFDILNPFFKTAIKIRPSVSEAGSEAIKFIREKGLYELSNLKNGQGVIIMIISSERYFLNVLRNYSNYL